jgi:translation initiation factor IF-3
MMDRPVTDRGPRVNERIRVREVRCVDSNGDQLGVLATETALARAKEQGLDLVEVADKARPPVCKIMDYGKYKYELKLKRRQNAKKQHKVVLKEVRIRPKTGEHDYQVKIKHARRFLKKGYKVQVNVLFRGRERAHTDIARAHLDRMSKDLADLGKTESGPKMEGYRMIMVLAPTHLPKEKDKKRGDKKVKGKGKRTRRGQSSAESSAEIDAIEETTESALTASEDLMNSDDATALEDSGDETEGEDTAEEA